MKHRVVREIQGGETYEYIPLVSNCAYLLVAA
jgi:hypothetical protein